MTTPSKTWVRRRVPSMTWKWTRRRSPAWKVGTRRSYARSRLSMTLLMGSAQRKARAAWGPGASHGSEGFAEDSRLGPPHARAAPALPTPRPPPRADLLVVAREQDLRDLPSP